MSAPSFKPEGTKYDHSEEKIHAVLQSTILFEGDLKTEIGNLNKRIQKLAEDDGGTDDRRLDGVQVIVSDDEMQEWLTNKFDIGKDELVTEYQKERLYCETERAKLYRKLHRVQDRISRDCVLLDQLGLAPRMDFFEGNQNDAELYTMMVKLESSLRRLILRKFGNDETIWWEEKIDKGIRDDIIKKKKDELPSERKFRDVEYLDFADYLQVIVESTLPKGTKSTNWDEFKDVFGIYGNDESDKRWLGSRLDELKTMRNVIMHRPPLGKQEEKKFRMYYGEIVEAIRKKES